MKVDLTKTKKRRKIPVQIDEITDPVKKEEKILEKLAMLRHRDLQRECIMRGLEFQKVVEYDHNKLSSFYLKNYDQETQAGLLDQYDLWLEEELQKRGHKKGDAMLSPSFRMGFVDIKKIEGPIRESSRKKENPSEPKEIKPKREKDEDLGIIKGTKKALTYSLAIAGKDIDDIITQVIAKFPDAKDKSIRIWAKRAVKENS